jgi:hypothetical protein
MREVEEPYGLDGDHVAVIDKKILASKSSRTLSRAVEVARRHR